MRAGGGPGRARGRTASPTAGTPSCSGVVPSARCGPRRAVRPERRCVMPSPRERAEDRMSKRIHELAKEWGQNPKDLLTVAERVGIRGKRSQSALTDEEVTRLRDVLGLTPRPAVTVGSERVV